MLKRKRNQSRNVGGKLPAFADSQIRKTWIDAYAHPNSPLRPVSEMFHSISLLPQSLPQQLVPYRYRSALV
jgi:hypothetical protein